MSEDTLFLIGNLWLVAAMFQFPAPRFYVCMALAGAAFGGYMSA